jgi:hypothetical protein
MTQRRGTTIKQGAVADVMSCLSKMPDRGKAPDTAVSLTEIFRTKEYLAEIKGALKKGYSFNDLAQIFTEKCEVNISARQLKYHCTREKNRSAKNSAGRKTSRHAASKSDVQPENPARIKSGADAEKEIENAEEAVNATPIFPNSAAFVAPNAEVMSAVAGTPSFENRPPDG